MLCCYVTQRIKLTYPILQSDYKGHIEPRNIKMLTTNRLSTLLQLLNSLHHQPISVKTGNRRRNYIEFHARDLLKQTILEDL